MRHYQSPLTTEYRRSATSRSLFLLHRRRSHSVAGQDFSLAGPHAHFMARMFFQTLSPTLWPGQYQVGVPQARRPLVPDRTSGKVHYLGNAPEERHYGYVGDSDRARGDSD